MATTLTQLTERAMVLRERFAELAQVRGARPWAREELMQGLVVDVGDLMKLVMAKQGLRDVDHLDQRLAHELADCLWSILVLARLYDVDLERAFFAMEEEASAKLAKQQAAVRAGD